MSSTVAERLLTEDDFLALESDPHGRKRELFDGAVIHLSQPGRIHSRLAMAIVFALMSFAEPRRIGQAFMDAGFLIRTDPDRVVCPDASVARAESLAGDAWKTVRGAPLLAVEVRSPNDRRGPVAAKIAEYLEAGSTRVWDVDPVRRTVTVHGFEAGPRVLRDGDVLTSEDAGFEVEGFALPIRDLFDAAGA